MEKQSHDQRNLLRATAKAQAKLGEQGAWLPAGQKVGQSFSTMALRTLWAGEFLAGAMYGGMVSSIPGLDPPDVIIKCFQTLSNISWGTKITCLRTTVLKAFRTHSSIYLLNKFMRQLLKND